LLHHHRRRHDGHHNHHHLDNLSSFLSRLVRHSWIETPKEKERHGGGGGGGGLCLWVGWRKNPPKLILYGIWNRFYRFCG
jgi:hypothetical protein